MDNYSIAWQWHIHQPVISDTDAADYWIVAV